MIAEYIITLVCRKIRRVQAGKESDIMTEGFPSGMQ